MQVQFSNCDVAVDLPAVRARFGAAATDALEDDLRHLSLELLWSHLPRHRGGMTTLQARVSAVLGPAVGAETAPLLQVRLPKSPTGPQRLRLSVTTFAELQEERWYVAPRHTWDVRRTADGPVADPVVADLLAAGEYVRAWEACGFSVPELPGPASPVGAAEAIRAAAAAFDVPSVATLYDVSLAVDAATLAAEPLDVSEYLDVPVRVLLPSLITPPDVPDLAPRAVARVRCLGDWHKVGVADGLLRLYDHDEPDQLRERALRALGGSAHGCFAVESAWTTGVGRLPRVLSDELRSVKHRLQHGDTDWLLSALSAGTVDPRMRDANGWSLLHMTMWLDHTRVLPLLLSAGLPVDTPDRVGRTPLYLAVMNGASPSYMQELLTAGADPTAATVHGSTASYVAASRNGWQPLPFLTS